MGSEPRTSDPAGPGEATMGRAMTARMQPRLALADHGRRHPRPGHLMRSTRAFGMRLGLSSQNRRAYDASLGALLSAPSRPPIQYWPWADDGEVVENSAAPAGLARPTPPPAAAPAPKVDKRVEALRRKIMGRAGASPTAPGTIGSAAAPAAAAQQEPEAMPDRVRVHRGLPLTPRRRGRTWAGPRTSPGGMATGAAPQATTSVSSSRFGSDAPEPLPAIAQTNVTDADRSSGSRPAAPRLSWRAVAAYPRRP
jgi:hypothetical protein